MEQPSTDEPRGCSTGTRVCLPIAKSALVGVLSMAQSKGDRDGLKACEMLWEAHVGLGRRSLQQECASDLERTGDLAMMGREGQL